MEEEIEYLEEYEELILPSIKSNTSAEKRQKNMASMSDDEDSSSIDQDIFESLFDDHSDDDTGLQKKESSKSNQRRNERDSMDSLDLLVKDLGEPGAAKRARTAGAKQKLSFGSVAESKKLSKDYRPPSTSKHEKFESTSKATSSMRAGKPKSVATVRPTIQNQSQPKRPITKTVMSNRVVSTNSIGSSTPRAGNSSLQALQARTQTSATSTITMAATVQAETSGSVTTQKLGRSQPTIIKPEKPLSRDPIEDPLSLEDLGPISNTDSDSMSLSDISADSFMSLSDDDYGRSVIELSNDSTLERANLDKIRGTTPSPTLSEDFKSDTEDATKKLLIGAEQSTAQPPQRQLVSCEKASSACSNIQMNQENVKVSSHEESKVSYRGKNTDSETKEAPIKNDDEEPPQSIREPTPRQTNADSNDANADDKTRTNKIEPSMSKTSTETNDLILEVSHTSNAAGVKRKLTGNSKIASTERKKPKSKDVSVEKKDTDNKMHVETTQESQVDEVDEKCDKKLPNTLKSKRSEEDDKVASEKSNEGNETFEQLNENEATSNIGDNGDKDGKSEGKLSKETSAERNKRLTRSNRKVEAAVQETDQISKRDSTNEQKMLTVDSGALKRVDELKKSFTSKDVPASPSMEHERREESLTNDAGVPTSTENVQQNKRKNFISDDFSTKITPVALNEESIDVNCGDKNSKNTRKGLKLRRKRRNVDEENAKKSGQKDVATLQEETHQGTTENKSEEYLIASARTNQNRGDDKSDNSQSNDIIECGSENNKCYTKSTPKVESFDYEANLDSTESHKRGLFLNAKECIKTAQNESELNGAKQHENADKTHLALTDSIISKKCQNEIASTVDANKGSLSTVNKIVCETNETGCLPVGDNTEESNEKNLSGTFKGNTDAGTAENNSEKLSSEKLGCESVQATTQNTDNSRSSSKLRGRDLPDDGKKNIEEKCLKNAQIQVPDSCHETENDTHKRNVLAANQTHENLKNNDDCGEEEEALRRRSLRNRATEQTPLTDKKTKEHPSPCGTKQKEADVITVTTSVRKVGRPRGSHKRNKDDLGQKNKAQTTSIRRSNRLSVDSDVINNTVTAVLSSSIETKSPNKRSTKQIPESKCGVSDLEQKYKSQSAFKRKATRVSNESCNSSPNVEKLDGKVTSDANTSEKITQLPVKSNSEVGNKTPRDIIPSSKTESAVLTDDCKSKKTPQSKVKNSPRFDCSKVKIKVKISEPPKKKPRLDLAQKKVREPEKITQNVDKSLKVKKSQISTQRLGSEIIKIIEESKKKLNLDDNVKMYTPEKRSQRLKAIDDDSFRGFDNTNDIEDPPSQSECFRNDQSKMETASVFIERQSVHRKATTKNLDSSEQDKRNEQHEKTPSSAMNANIKESSPAKKLRVSPKKSSLSAVITFNEWLNQQQFQAAEKNILPSQEESSVPKESQSRKSLKKINAEKSTSAKSKETALALEVKADKKAVLKKTRKSEADILKQDTPKEMKDGGIELLFKEKVPRKTTKISLGNMGRSPEVSATNPMISIEKRLNKSKDFKTPPLPQKPSATSTYSLKNTVSSKAKNVHEVNTINKQKAFEIEKTKKSGHFRKSLKLRKVCVRLSRSIVTSYLKQLKSKQHTVRNETSNVMSSNPPKAQAKVAGPANILTIPPHQRRPLTMASTATHQIEPSLLTPAKTATTNAQEIVSRRSRPPFSQYKRQEVQQSQQNVHASSSTIIEQPSHSANISQQDSGSVLPVEPKEEIDDIVLNAPGTLANNRVFSSRAVGSPALIQTSLSAPGTNFGVAPLAVDPNGTPLYSFLHPAKYKRCHGNMLLDYCCPNLDGPMPAIDPTRIHTQVQTAVRELPAYIVMTTKLITRADLEADKNVVPAMVRQKVEKITANAAAPSNLPASINNTLPLPNQATSLPSLTSSLSVLQKQLPASTVLTPKVMPPSQTTKSGTAAASSSSGSPLLYSTLQAQKQKTDYQRSLLRSQLRQFDAQLQKNHLLISLVPFAKRQQAIEGLVTSTELSSKDVENAVKLLDQFTAQINSIPNAVTTSSSQQSKQTAPSNVVKKLKNVTVRKTPIVQPQHNRAQQNRQTPIYDPDNQNIIGYQFQMPTPSSSGVVLNSKAPAAAVSTKRTPTSSSCVSKAPKPTMKATIQDTPRIFYTKTPAQAAVQSLTSVGTTPMGAAIRLQNEPRIGREVTVRQVQATPSNGSVPLLSSLPTLTRNPHLSAASISATCTTTAVTTKTSVTIRHTPQRMTRRTAADVASKVIVVTQDENGHEQNAEECILPDNNSVPAIKHENVEEDFISGN